MPHCPNCGRSVGESHHYCGSCGNALSDIAETESEPPVAFERDGFLSHRSISYISSLVSGEETLERESVAYKKLQREVDSAFADFARLAVVDDLNLLVLWASGSHSVSIEDPVEDMNHHEFQDWLAKVGLLRTLRLYDDAIGTNFEDEFLEQLVEVMEQVDGELDITGMDEDDDAA